MQKIKIRSITKLKEHKKVYDLSVGGNHNFFIGDTHTLTSNCDFLSTNAQSSLRNLMETFSVNTRFILTCNYVEKIISPLVSRCQSFEIEPPNKKQVALCLKKIFDSENLTYTVNDIKSIVNDFYPDIRKMINYSQQVSSDGTVRCIKNQIAGHELHNKVLHELKHVSATSFTTIRTIIADSGIRTFDGLYRCLFDNINFICDNKPDKIAEIIITLAEYTYQSSLVVDKEITFMACISTILNSLKS